MSVIEVIVLLLLALLFLTGVVATCVFVYRIARRLMQIRPGWSKGTWATRIGVALVWLGAVGVFIAQWRLPWLNVYEWVRFGDVEVSMPFYDVFYPDLPRGGRYLPGFLHDYSEIFWLASVALFLSFMHEELWEDLSKPQWAVGFALIGSTFVWMFLMNREVMLRAQRAIDPAHAIEIGDGALTYTFAMAAIMLGLVIIAVTGVVRRRTVKQPRALATK